MTRPLRLHPDRLFPADPTTRAIARTLYAEVAHLPILSPHGHTDPSWFATDAPFENAIELLLEPGHYVFRMLYSQGISLQSLGIDDSKADPRAAWQMFAANYHLFRGTSSRMWLDHVWAEVFGFDVAFDAATADHYYDTIIAALATDMFRPRAMFDRFNIELIATTESPIDSLDNLAKLAAMVGEDTQSYVGYLAALRRRRADFAAMGATSTESRLPDSTDCRLKRSRGRGTVRACHQARAHARRCRTVPRAYAHRNGG
ncbi:MAG: glucuronate isomerase, partial [Novosphingobium sp.]|nr:glucuronate isomerase [Novosphingobium sp.]